MRCFVCVCVFAVANGYDTIRTNEMRYGYGYGIWMPRGADYYGWMDGWLVGVMCVCVHYIPASAPRGPGEEAGASKHLFSRGGSHPHHAGPCERLCLGEGWGLCSGEIWVGRYLGCCLVNVGLV